MNKKIIYNKICSYHKAEQRAIIRSINTFEKHFPEAAIDFKNWNCCDYIKTLSFSKQLWHYLKDDFDAELAKCKICGNVCRFISFSKGYLSFCSKKCAQICDETKEKRRHTVQKTYGCYNIMQETSINNKRLSTNNIRYNGTGFGSNITAKKSYNTIDEKFNGILGFKKHVGNLQKQKTIDKYPDVIDHKNDFWICKCTNPSCDKCVDKIFEISPNIYYYRVDNNYEKCTKLNPVSHRSSELENKFKTYIKEIYKGCIIENDRKILDGKEIDIYLPDLKLGFEFNGDYWHMNPRFYNADAYMSCRNQYAYEIWNRDAEKAVLAESKNIVLVIVWEHDWNSNKENIKNEIRQIIESKMLQKL